jgi:hypothetical protein
MSNHGKLLQDNLDQALIEAIDEGLLSIGSLPREVMLRNLENYFQIKKDDIPLNLAKFEDVLQTVFGSGTRYLERSIAQRLCEKLNLGVIGLESSSLVGCVDELKRQLLLRGERK